MNAFMKFAETSLQDNPLLKIAKETPNKSLDTNKLDKPIGISKGEGVSERIGLIDVEKIESLGKEKTSDVNANSTEVKSENQEVNEKLPIQNKIDGIRREKEVEMELKEKYPESEGYSIEQEVYLRDADGNIVKDQETGKARRIDFAVVKDGEVVDTIEVTSNTASKEAQSAKEERIRESGGNYIKDSNGDIVNIPETVKTRIERRD